MVQLLSPAAVARRLRVSPSTARRWMLSGAIPSVRDGRGWLFASEKAVNAFRRRRARRVRRVSPRGRLERIGRRADVMREG
jgi:excisionase family DNA binding protein